MSEESKAVAAYLSGESRRDFRSLMRSWSRRWRQGRATDNLELQFVALRQAIYWREMSRNF